MSDCSSDCDHSVRCCGDLPQLRVTLPVILVLPILQPGLRDIVRVGKGGDERLHNAEEQHNDRQERLSRQRAAHGEQAPDRQNAEQRRRQDRHARAGA